LKYLDICPICSYLAIFHVFLNRSSKKDPVLSWDWVKLQKTVRNNCKSHD
jgi:hypothetical protein